MAKGKRTGKSAACLEAWRGGAIPRTSSLTAAFSSFPDELPYLKCPLHTVLKLTPVALVRAPHPSMERHAVLTVCTTGIIHHASAGVSGILHLSPAIPPTSPPPHTHAPQATHLET